MTSGGVVVQTSRSSIGRILYTSDTRRTRLYKSTHIVFLLRAYLLVHDVAGAH